MRGRVVMVLEEPECNDQTSAALRRAGYEVVAFLDPAAAVSARTPERHTDILATRAHFVPGEHGVSLVRPARTWSPGLLVLFTGVSGS
jgi:DNA-binding response OmpR family regulator